MSTGDNSGCAAYARVELAVGGDLCTECSVESAAEGAELVLIGARENPEQELGIAFEPENEPAHHAS